MALSMTANGADGDTLDEMEKTLGMTKDELNDLSYDKLFTIRGNLLCSMVI